jgi:predicted esterase
MRAMLLALLTASAFAQSPVRPALPANEATVLRKQLTEALADPGSSAARDLGKRAGSLAGKYELASVFAALREGPLYGKGEPKPRGSGKKAERLTRFGTTVVGYTFAHGKDTFRYAVDIPQGYDGSKAVPLLLDPGHGTGKGKADKEKADFLPFFRGQLDAAGLQTALVVRTELVEQIGADGERGARPEDEVAAVFHACLRDVVSRFHVDLDRVWISGLSQTGFWAWQLGAARADRLAGIAPMSAVTWNVNQYLPNFAHLPVAVLHGEGDTVCPVAQPRQTVKELERLQFPVRYQEVAGAGHDVKVWGQLHTSLQWLAEKPRHRWPRDVQKHLQTLGDPFCYWLRIDALARSGSGAAGKPPTARVRGTIEGQAITLLTEGVKELTVCGHPELWDLDQPVTITWNGKPVFQGTFRRDAQAAAQLLLQRADWSMLFEAVQTLKAP